MLDDEVAALDPAVTAHFSGKPNSNLRYEIGEYGDPKNLGAILRPRNEWPRSYAADKRDELAPHHCLLCPQMTWRRA